MESLNASDAKREFGELLIKAQHGPVSINKNGKPVAVMLSAAEYAKIENIREQLLKEAIQQGVADIKAGRTSEGEAVLQRLREKVDG